MSNNLGLDYVKAGACLHSKTNAFLSCALQPSDCNYLRPPHDSLTDARFVSYKWISDNDFVDIVKECTNQGNIRSTPSLGRCDGDSGICTTDASACESPSTFTRPDYGCTLGKDWTQDVEPSYGHCSLVSNSADDYCAWRQEECGTGYRFNIAGTSRTNNYPDCHCDATHVGACLTNNSGDDYYCAVHPSVCADNETYLPALDFQDSFKLSCRLCKFWVPFTLTAPILANPSTHPFRRTAWVVGGTSMGLVAVGVVRAVLFFLRGKKRKEQPKKVVEEVELVVELPKEKVIT